MKIFFPLAALLLAPCLYSQAGLSFGEPGALSGGAGLTKPGLTKPELGESSLFFGGESHGARAELSRGFDGMFRTPDFGTPRLTKLAGASGAGTESPESAASPVPLWLKDIRRAEIVAFGSFPLTLFWTSFFMDLYRTASHGWDNRYAPWPFKGAGAVGMTNQEISMMFTIAVSSSLVIAVVDHFILRYRRSRTRDLEKPVPLDKRPVLIPGD
ncbi:MAG: hypothetical protein LBH35_06575 [Treponema sp.]|nr:hypothetical protein [Treponema sp.]